MINKGLCNPQYTKFLSARRIKFNLFLSSIHRRNKEIPLTANEIANYLNFTVETVKRFIVEAECDGTVARQEDKLLFNKGVNEGDHYVKHFNFLNSEEFLREDVMVIRFVLWALERGVYSGYTINIGLDKLYHRLDKNKQITREGIFNVYYAGKMKDIIEKSKKYLIFSPAPEGIVRIVGLQPQYAKQPVIKNQGEYLYIRKIFVKYDVPDISSPVIEEIMKVFSRYRKNFTNDLVSEITQESICRVIHTENSKFLSLILQENLQEKDLREIGHYFSAVSQQIELEMAARIKQQKDLLDHSLRNLHAVLHFKFGAAHAIKTCADLFHKSLSSALDKIIQYIDAFDGYWSSMVMNARPERQAGLVDKYEKNILFKQLPFFPKLIEKFREKRKYHVDPEPFPFYNWLIEGEEGC